MTGVQTCALPISDTIHNLVVDGKPREEQRENDGHAGNRQNELVQVGDAFLEQRALFSSDIALLALLLQGFDEFGFLSVALEQIPGLAGLDFEADELEPLVF